MGHKHHVARGALAKVVDFDVTIDARVNATDAVALPIEHVVSAYALPVVLLHTIEPGAVVPNHLPLNLVRDPLELALDDFR